MSTASSRVATSTSGGAKRRQRRRPSASAAHHQADHHHRRATVLGILQCQRAGDNIINLIFGPRTSGLADCAYWSLVSPQPGQLRLIYLSALTSNNLRWKISHERTLYAAGVKPRTNSSELTLPITESPLRLFRTIFVLHVRGSIGPLRSHQTSEVSIGLNKILSNNSWSIQVQSSLASKVFFCTVFNLMPIAAKKTVKQLIF